MIAVLDASAAVSLVMGRDPSGRISKAIADAGWILAPRLFASECCNALWKYHKFEAMPVDHCEAAMDQCLAIPDSYVDDEDLAREAFAMACLTGMTVYDSMFMVLARRNNALLLSSDKALIRAAKKQSIRV